MAEENKKPDEATVPIAGLVILALIGYGVYKGVQLFINRNQAPPPIVALSAYFAGEDGNPVLDEKAPNAHLKIKGQVQRPDNKETDGKVRVTVSTLDQAFSQTLIVDTKGGNFETEDVSLRKLRPSDEIYIKAEFLTANASEQTPGEIYLNTRPPKITSDTIWVVTVTFLLIVFIVFFYSFTGKKTPLKNRIAVIFSYCVIGIFLFLPLMAPLLLVPGDRRAMLDRPVGLVLTKVGLEPDAKVQWALNIGGYAATPQPSVQPSPPPSPSPGATSRTPSPAVTATGQPIGSPGQLPATGENRSASPSPAQTAARTRQSGGNPPAGTRSESPTPTPQVSEDTDEDLIVDVQGGLVIPLYVIILSVIGGAINMTRKVPQLQEEGERSDLAGALRRPTLKSVWAATFGRIRRSSSATVPTTSNEAPGATEEPEGPAPAAHATPSASAPATTASTTTASQPADDAAATEIDTKVDQLLDTYAKSDAEAQNAKSDLRNLMNKMRELFDKRTDKKPILHYDSFDDWVESRPALKEMFTTHWRVELLSQYMYLVSAPFLAIVAYYMLQLAGLTKQPILVVISFSVGLVSERILSWLLGIASGYLRDSPTPAAKT